MRCLAQLDTRAQGKFCRREDALAERLSEGIILAQGQEIVVQAERAWIAHSYVSC